MRVLGKGEQNHARLSVSTSSACLISAFMGTSGKLSILYGQTVSIFLEHEIVWIFVSNFPDLWIMGGGGVQTGRNDLPYL